MTGGSRYFPERLIAEYFLLRWLGVKSEKWSEKKEKKLVAPRLNLYIIPI